MDKKSFQKDLKSPDAIQKELRKGFEWTTQHSTLVASVLGILVLAGAGFGLKSYVDNKNEQEIQAQYFLAEKAFLEQKQKFLEARDEQLRLAADKKTNNSANETKSKIQSTGDFAQDYGSQAAALEKIIQESPKSKAAKMAALNLAQVQIEYNQLDSAQKNLESVQSSSKDLLSAMVESELGSLKANKTDCQSALTHWQNVLKNNKVQFMHPAVHLKMGLCFESMSDLAKAEESYLKAQNAEKNSSIAKSAEKYLQLLQAKKL